MKAVMMTFGYHTLLDCLACLVYLDEQVTVGADLFGLNDTSMICRVDGPSCTRTRSPPCGTDRGPARFLAALSLLLNQVAGADGCLD